MKTEHRTLCADSTNMEALDDKSVDLVVTSPPYPMIEMWDEMFFDQDPGIKSDIHSGNGPAAFEKMHRLLDKTWKETYRVLKTGGFACINIGDATRTIDGDFALYPNHARILSNAGKLGFSALPCILWRKQTNAPNKFMGSGMLPAGAYVTLEHEYVLVLRKGPKRAFISAADKTRRRESALFWEERNVWFSDIWLDIKGIQQAVKEKDTRRRSAAYPFDLPYRLINMYSAKNDLVLDPFLGMGTTTLAAMASARNSIGYEIDGSLQKVTAGLQKEMAKTSAQINRLRLAGHLSFVHQRLQEKGPLKHTNTHYGFPVMTAQEKELIINDIKQIDTMDDKTIVHYDPSVQPEFCFEWSDDFSQKTIPPFPGSKHPEKQMTLF